MIKIEINIIPSLSPFSEEYGDVGLHWRHSFSVRRKSGFRRSRRKLGEVIRIA